MNAPHKKSLTQLARHLRNHATDAERQLWQELRDLKKLGFHFRRQARIGRYIVDFVCHAEKLIIELDGGHHGEDDIRKKDEKRTAWLETQGYQVRRYWNHEVYEDRHQIIDHLVHILTTAPKTKIETQK